jgi:catechol 2,3-dioxygenase-like lactoylglutathione lyase family enzyme
MLKPVKNALDLGVVVGDVTASLNFYQNLLGLEFVETVSLKFGTMHRLRFGQSDFKLVEPKNKPPLGAIGLDRQIGFRYVTFVIENLSEVCRSLSQKGVEVVVPETELRPGVRIAMVKDPDGNIVEFVEKK